MSFLAFADFRPHLDIEAGKSNAAQINILRRNTVQTIGQELREGSEVFQFRITQIDQLRDVASREEPRADPAAVFTQDELQLFDQATPERKRQAQRELEFYVRAVARLGDISTALQMSHRGRR